MAFDEVILLLCGNFNPISNMHLRMLEIAKDHLVDNGYSVYKGVLSLFEENSLSLDHRIAMIKYALCSSDWIQLSAWNCEKRDISCIEKILQQHQRGLCFINKNISLDDDERKSTVPKIDTRSRGAVVKLLCGADVLLFLTNFSSISEAQKILTNHGLVVIAREGYDTEKIIYENDILWTNRKNIIVIRDQVENQISSTKIRRAASRGQSIRYLVNDAVERYVYLHNLYFVPTCEYKSLDDNKTVGIISSYEAIDSFQDLTWCSHSKFDTSSETLTISTTAKKSKLSGSHKSKAVRIKKDAHFKDADRSKLIEIPLTEDGVIQIIADKETNL